MKRLSARKVANAKPPRGRDAVLLADGANLFLQVTRGPGGNIRRSWVFRFELRGRRREAGLGGTHTVTLSEARNRARALRQQLLDHVDPIAARDQAREAAALEAQKHRTFAETAKQYLDAHRHDWRDIKHVKQWEYSLFVEAKAIGQVSVSAINVGHILEILRPIWHAKPESASRTRGRLERVLAYAVAAGYRSAEAGNPAKWDGSLGELLGAKTAALRLKRQRENKPEHFAAVPYDRVPELMRALRQRDSLSARALEFCVLTATRSKEILSAEWREIDLVERTWSIPAHKMKSGKPHKIPLSDRAVEILRRLPRDGERVFPLAVNTMLACLHASWPGKATVHGFRSGFVDFSHERTAFPKVVIDMALAHAVGDRVEAAYRRGTLIEKRKQLMQVWSDHCASSPIEKVATVTPLRQPREH